MEIGSTASIGSGIPIDKKTATRYVHNAEEQAQLEAEGWKTKLVPLVARPLTDVEIAADATARAEAEARLRQMLRMPDNEPNKLWGQIVKDGKIIGEIYESGIASAPGYIKHKSQDPAGRAKEIMAVFGGSLRKPYQIPDYAEWLRTASDTMAKSVAKLAEEHLESLEKQYGAVSENLLRDVAKFKAWAETAFAEPDLAAQLADEIMQTVAKSVEVSVAYRIVEAVAAEETETA